MVGFRNSLLIYMLGLVAGLFFLLYVRNSSDVSKSKNYNKIPTLTIYVIGLLTRLFTAVIFEGHPIDISCFKGWASIVANSLSTFYTNGGFADYPPLYIYVLFFVEKIRLLLFSTSPEWVHTLIIKSPAIVADIICSYILYHYGKRFLDDKKAMLISFIYLFNPVTILTSSLWGQVDSIFMLLLSIAIIRLSDKKYTISTVWFALAVLLKPQGLIFLPVLFFVLVKEKDIKLLGKCLLTGLITFILPVIPFTGNQRFDWIVKLYISTTSSYKGASLNAYNFFALLGANWKNDSEKLFIFSYSTWGFIFIIMTTLITTWYILTSKNAAIPASASAILIIGVYVLSSKMHERYIFPAMMLLLMFYIVYSKTELLILHFGFTITAFVNILQVFYLSQSKIYWVPANDIILKVISFANLVLMVVTFIIIITSRFYEPKSAGNFGFSKKKVTSTYTYKRSKKGRKS